MFVNDKVPLSKVLEDTKDIMLGDIKKIQYQTNKNIFIYDLKQNIYTRIEKSTNNQVILDFDIIKWLKLFLN